MPQIPPDASESSGLEVQTSPSNSTNEARGQVNESSEEYPKKSSWKNVACEWQPFASNFLALASRFIQLCLRPEDMASIILDFWSLSLSIIWTEKQSGLDLLYPLSSLKKQKSGRLARLLLEHSRDLQQCNLHEALSYRDGVDSPRVAVIDLDEVSPEIIERGYTVSADFYGFVAMLIFLEFLISPILYIFLPVDLSPCYEWLHGSPTGFYWIDAYLVFTAGLLEIASDSALRYTSAIIDIFLISLYAVLYGERTLTLVRRSDISIPGCAVLLDHDFTVILAGAQDVAEAIAESSFSMSHTLTSRFRSDSEAWQLGQRLFYPALKAWCAGIPFAILAGFWLSLNPTSRSIAFLPLVPIAVLSSATVVGTLICRSPQQSVSFKEFLDTAIPTHIRSLVSAVPTFLLILIYELVIVKDSLLRSILHPAIWFPPFTFILMAIHFISSQNYRIRTAKLLDILGSPPVRRWEFDTLHAAATFQCLVLCRGLPRPIESIDVLTLLDTFIPDEREVSKVWKARVADRITHEVDISFAPTLPSFGDERQRRLKELLDQAQIGYNAYKVFYDQHVPLHSTTSL